MDTAYRLAVVEGPDKGRVYSVPAKGCTIGRAEDNDLMLADGELSRHHCRLEIREGALWVVDLDSANGTTVGAREVREASLKEGDVVRIGATALRVGGFPRRQSAMLWTFSVAVLLAAAAIATKAVLGPIRSGREALASNAPPPTVKDDAATGDPAPDDSGPPPPSPAARRFAEVLVQSTPSGADIELDGRPVGQTPAHLPEVAMGPHRLALSLAGWRTGHVSLNVDSPTYRVVRVPLERDSATLRIESTPAGALALVNGEPHGATPVVADCVPAGTVSVELIAAGYRGFRCELQLAVGDDETIRAALEPIPATFRIETEPAGARVFLDEVPHGVAPVTIEGLEPREYLVRVDLDGHEPQTRTLTLGGGETVTNAFVLVENRGALVICTSPVNVSVFVDDVLRGVTPADPVGPDRVSLPLEIGFVSPGMHMVRFSRKGFHDVFRPVEVKRGEKLQLNVTLPRNFLPDYEVRTTENVYRGVFQNRTPEFVRVETEPGIISTVARKNILSERFLSEEEMEPSAAPSDAPDSPSTQDTPEPSDTPEPRDASEPSEPPQA